MQPPLAFYFSFQPMTAHRRGCRIETPRDGGSGRGVPLPSRLRGLEDRRKLHQRSSGRSPGQKRILEKLELENASDDKAQYSKIWHCSGALFQPGALRMCVPCLMVNPAMDTLHACLLPLSTTAPCPRIIQNYQDVRALETSCRVRRRTLQRLIDVDDRSMEYIS